jgi:hypothetical protein
MEENREKEHVSPYNACFAEQKADKRLIGAFLPKEFELGLLRQRKIIV